MKREIIKKVLSIIAVVIFSLSIIVGIVFSILSDKNKAVASASVDVVGDPVVYYVSGPRLPTSYDNILDFTDLYWPSIGFDGAYSTINGFSYFYQDSCWSNSGSFLRISDLNDDWSLLLINNDPENLYYALQEGDLFVFYNVGNLYPSQIDNLNSSSFVYLYYHSYDPDYDSAFEEGYNEGYNDGYNDGLSDSSGPSYRDGYNDGFSDGLDQGFNEGWEFGRVEGKREGYGQGYLDGYNDSHKDTGLTRYLTIEILATEESGYYSGGFQFPTLFYIPYGSSFTMPYIDAPGYSLSSITAELLDPDTGYRVGYNSCQPGQVIEELRYNLRLSFTVNSDSSAGGGDYQSGYQDGYEQGWNDGNDNGLFNGTSQGYDLGYSDGYGYGYSNGLNMGQSLGISNPVTFFFDSVQNFLSVNLFGSISIGAVLSVTVFVAVALVFLKMFAGG